MSLELTCKGIANVSVVGVSSGLIDVELQEVEMGFLEDLLSDDIVKNHDNEKLLGAMDADEVFEWVEKKFDVIIKENK